MDKILYQPVERILELADEFYNSKETIIKLIEDNKRLNQKLDKFKADVYKDKELADMKKKIDEYQENEKHSFILTPEEAKMIDYWIKVHTVIKHPTASAGAAGGRYTYEFTPTGLGTIGTIKCTCGEKFCFRNII